MNSNVKQCLHKTIDDHLTVSVKVLGSSGVPPCNGHTMKVLEAYTLI